MKNHCEKQHGFEPFSSSTAASSVRVPSQVQPASASSSKGASSKGLFVAAGRFAIMVHDLLNYRQLETGNVPTPLLLNAVRNPAKAIEYVLNNFVIIRKRIINGISGYICKNCLTFQFEYIKDIGYDLTAKEKHRCMPVKRLNSAGERAARQNQIYHESVRLLTELANSIFVGKKCIIAAAVKERYLPSLHTPILKLDSLSSSHWARAAIESRVNEVPLSDATLQKIIEEIRGTYSIVLVQSGNLAGHYLVYVSNMNRLV